MKCLTLTVLCCLAIGRYAGAVEKPPKSPEKQRTWLGGGLMKDINVTSTVMPDAFGKTDRSRVMAITNPKPNPIWEVSDKDVDRLAEYYYRTRRRAEEDLRQCRSESATQDQERRLSQEQIGKAENEHAATKDRDEISDLGGEVAEKGSAVATLGELIDMSLPGFCLRQQHAIPRSYFTWDEPTGTYYYVGLDNSVHTDICVVKTDIDENVFVDGRPEGPPPRGQYQPENMPPRGGRHNVQLPRAPRGPMGPHRPKRPPVGPLGNGGVAPQQPPHVSCPAPGPGAGIKISPHQNPPPKPATQLPNGKDPRRKH